VSASPLSLQGSGRAQVTEVLPSRPGPVTQCQWRHTCYLLPTGCACTKPGTACWRARAEQGGKQRRRHTACCSPQHASVHRTDPQGSPGSAPCAAVRRRPVAGGSRPPGHTRASQATAARPRGARRPSGEALDVRAAEGAERRLLAELAQAQRAVDAEPVAAAAHRHVQRLVQADACARARRVGRAPRQAGVPPEAPQLGAAAASQ